MKCIAEAWGRYENELRSFLYSRVDDSNLVEDLLQDVFLKALAQNSRFCAIDNTRAWLFRVTRNRLIDHFRTHHIHEEVPEELPEEIVAEEPVTKLSCCLPAALERLSTEDREAIERCDLGGMSQAEFARLKGLSTPGAKSRIQRARRRLRDALKTACNVNFDEQGNICCFDSCCDPDSY